MTQVCLVTMSSRGIGRATALRLAADGRDVVVKYVNREGAAQDVADQVQQAGRRRLAIRADVASRDAVRSMVRRTEVALGPIAVLVNNAGVYQRVTVEELEPDRWERTLGVNLSGAFHCIQAVLPAMRREGWGRIVNISRLADGMYTLTWGCGGQRIYGKADSRRCMGLTLIASEGGP